MDMKVDSEPVYGDNDKYIKITIKIYEGKVNTSFQGKNVSKENVSYNYLSLILLDSVIKASKKHSTKTLLEECKYEIKRT